MEFQRIAKTKTPLLGCVTRVEIRQSRSNGGYLVAQTTGSGNHWLMIPQLLFREWANLRRPFREQYKEPYTNADAKRVIEWLRTKMVRYRYTVRVGTEEGSDETITYYDGHIVGLMEDLK